MNQSQNKKPSNMKRFVAYYKPHKLLFSLDMTASFLVAAIGMGYPILTRLMLNDFIPEKKYTLIIISGSALLLIYLIRTLLRYFIQYYGHIMGVAMQATMRSELFTKIEKLPYKYFDEHETGKIMSRMTNDLFEISELAHHGPENIFIASFTIIGSLAYLCMINWLLAIICFCMVPILFGVSFHYRKKMKNAFMETRVAQAKINGAIESSISGVRVTKAYTNENIELDKFEESNKAFVEARHQSLSAMAKFMSSSQFVTDVFNVIILIAGGLFLYADKLTFGDYSTFIVSINLFISPVNQLINFMEQYQNASSGFNRFVEVLDEKEEVDTGTKELSNVKGNIEYKNVSMSYDEENKNILKGISISIKEGEKIALVGPTGGGKTTLCHILPRFYPISEGEISIDGINVNDCSLKSLRSAIGIVQQDVFLFAGTLKENIRYGNPKASEEEIIDAAKKANLYDFICTLPNGFETEIGERGVKLSGGQKQRVSIARAFLKNPSILVLDEATSALDNTTEFLIQQALDELCKGRTTIVVAHRLSTVKNANKIFVISGGKVVESGSHEDLMKVDGIYKSLYNLQFKEIDGEHQEILNKHILIS